MWRVTLRFHVLAAILVATAPAAQVLARDEVPWASNMQEALNKASHENRLVLVHFWAPDCAPCRRLEQNVFSLPQVGMSIADQYVPVKINVKASPEIARRYNVDRWPTDVIVTPAGYLVHKMTSPQEPRQYISLLRQIAARGPLPAQYTPVSGYTGQPPAYGYQSPPRGGSPSGYAQNSQPQYPGYNRPDSGYNHPGAQAPPTGPTNHHHQTSPAPVVGSGYGGKQYAGSTNRSQPVQPPQYGRSYGSPPTTEPRIGSYGPSPKEGYGNQPAPKDRQAKDRQARARQDAARQANPGIDSRPSRWSSNPTGAAAGTQQRAAAPRTTYRGGYYSGRSPQEPTPGYGHQQTQSPPLNNQPDYNRPRQKPAPYTDSTRDGPPLGNQQTHAPRTSAPAGGAAKGLDGYCPITLFEKGSWENGDSRWGAVHRGQTYLFTGPREQQIFLANPDRYSPVLSGNDPIRYAQQQQLVAGHRKHGLFYQNQVYLFAEESTLQAFSANPKKYAEIVHQAMRQIDGRKR